jgi:hypothetical protein
MHPLAIDLAASAKENGVTSHSMAFVCQKDNDFVEKQHTVVGLLFHLFDTPAVIGGPRSSSL